MTARTLTWRTGGTSTDFALATNWDDNTSPSFPALAAPVPGDTVIFGTGTATVSGTGTVANIFVESSGPWVLSGATLTDTAGLGIDNGGNLTLTAGSTLSSSATYDIIGNLTGSVGSATITGTGAKWTDANPLILGNFGSGSMTVASGAVVTEGSNITVGQFAGATGTLRILAGGTVRISGTPAAGSAAFIIGNAGTTTDAGGNLVLGASGTVEVAGAGALLDLNGNSTDIGSTGTGSLIIAQGGTVLAGIADTNTRPAVRLGNTAGSVGSLLITDAGSTLIDSGNFVLARGGTGLLTVTNHATLLVTTDSLGVGGLGIGSGSGGNAANIGGVAIATLSNYGLAKSSIGITVGSSGVDGTLNVSGGAIAEAGFGFTFAGTRVISGSTYTTKAVVNVGAGGTLLTDADIAPGGSAMNIGSGAGSRATVNVSGTGALINTNTQNMVIGNAGSGTLNITQGGTVLVGAQSTFDAAASIGGGIGGQGWLILSDANSTFTARGQLNVGDSGTGHVLVENHATLTTGNQAANASAGIVISRSGFGPSDATVTGAGSQLTNTGQFIVGQFGYASLAIDAGGTVSTSAPVGAGVQGAEIASAAQAAGSNVAVAGTGSAWRVGGQLVVGNAGAGSLGVTTGGTVTADTLDLGMAAAGSGLVSVTGSGAAVTIAGSVTLGDAGHAGLSIFGAGTLSASDVLIGVSAGASGNVDLEGAGSRLSIANDLTIGGAGTGVVTVGQGATLSVVNNLNQGANGILTIAGGVVDPASGTITGATTISSNGVLQYTNTLTLKGQIVVQSGGGTLELAHITGNGTLVVGTNGTMVLADGTGGTGGPLFVGATVPTIAFSDVNGTLVINDIAGLTSSVVISGFATGDQIQVGTAFASMSYAGGVLTFYSDVGQSNPVGTLFFSGSHTISDFQSAVTEIACFQAGTHLLTMQGEIAVERIAVGDLLPTLARGGAIRRVCWVGRTEVDVRSHPDPARVAPVIVQTGAFAPGVPHRDLHLSPDHSVLVDGALVPVHLLLNGASIRQDLSAGHVTYLHVELDTHDAVLAEGLAAETYLDTGNRAAFEGGVFAGAEAARAIWASSGCAPLLLEGERLTALHARLARRAEQLGHRRTADPGLEIIAQGIRMLPERVDDTTWRVRLPADTRRVALRSRSLVPDQTDRRLNDRRRLGVALASVRLDGREFALSACATGFHAPEAAWRWTDGAGELAVPGGGLLELRATAGQYWLAD